MEHARVRGFAIDIAIDADPMHLAVHRHLLFADDGDVVLRLAGNVQTPQPVQVSDRSPFPRRGRCRRRPGKAFLVAGGGSSISRARAVAVKCRERADADQFAVFHFPMVLRCDRSLRSPVFSIRGRCRPMARPVRSA